MTDRLSGRFRIALAQLNPVMGDIAGNLARARAARESARDADLILFSELFITGYPPEDLVLKPALQEDARAAIESLAAETREGPAVLIGAPWVEDHKLYNAFLLLEGGRIAGKTFKVDLPNYGVFDEKRVFSAGPRPQPFTIGGIKVGVPVCEDIWTDKITGCLKEAGAEILAVPNGSPFEAGKEELRLLLAKSRVAETGLPLIYLNQLGGQDELVFDGASFVVNADGGLAWSLPGWREKLVITDWARDAEGKWFCAPGELSGAEERCSQVYHAMMLGLRDYVNKNRFPGVVLGLSGGIDSALSAAVAVDALGADRVRCVMLPSRYTSRESLEDADACALALGTPYETIEIERAVAAMGETLSPVFAGKTADTTEENIQSRLRGLILMAISNKFGPMVLTTGNKSEMSVGYATLYGDMCGGYNVLKDIYKTEVFALARWRNQFSPEGALGPRGHVIPERIIDKPPSAELRPNQTDQDSLPPYEILDGILECLVEHEMSFTETVAKGYDPAIVKRVEQLLYVSEYKRRQAPPGVKISSRNFGRDRRYPITNAFRGRTMSVIVRFAPSPTGLLHVGNARTALLNYLFARKMGGRFLLRIDDTDAARSTKAFEEAIYRDLEWLGIRHDLTDRQLNRLKVYSTAFYRLQASGRVYPCYETEAELERQRALLKMRKLPPIYDRAALKLTDADRARLEAEGRKPHWRFKLSRQKVAWRDLVRGPVEIDTATMSDPVLVREDGAFLYTLPSVADDIDFAISHVVRGEDHVTNTAAQIEIFQALDAPVPQFAHFPLLVGAGGEALSKRLGSLSLEELARDGMEPMAVAAYLAKIGTSDAIEPRLSLDELAREFDFTKIGRAPAHFDPEELKALNARTLHLLPYDAARLQPMGISESLWQAIRPNLTRIADAESLAQLVTGPVTPVIEDAGLAAKAATLLPPEPWDEATWGAWTGAVSAETGAKGRGLFHPLRLALTGRGDGPELKKLLPLIGRSKALARLEGKTA